MGAQKVLLDNATLNHSVRVLEGSITGHIDDEFYDASLNNLIHAIVLYKEIYVLETDFPSSWRKSALAPKLDQIIKSIHLKESDIFDLAETAFAKTSSFVMSPVGCKYIDNILINAIRQMQRKNFIPEEELSDSWERSKIFAHTEISYIRKQRNNLRDLLITYCRVLFDNKTLSEMDAIKLFKGNYDIPLELAMSLLYWLIYRTHFYHVGAVGLIPHKKKQPSCTYFPIPMRAEVSGIEPRIMNVDILSLYQQAIRQYDEDAAEEFKRKTGIGLVITPVPSVFRMVVNRSSTLTEIIDKAIDLRNSKQAKDFRERLINLEYKIVKGEEVKEITWDLIDLKRLIYSEWNVPYTHSETAGSNMVLSASPTIGIGEVKFEVGRVSFRAVQRFRQRARLASLVKMFRSYSHINGEMHTIGRFYNLPVNKEDKKGKDIENITEKRKRVRGMLAQAPERHKIASLRGQIYSPPAIELATSSYYALRDS